MPINLSFSNAASFADSNLSKVLIVVIKLALASWSIIHHYPP